MREWSCGSMQTGKTLWTIDEEVVDSWKEVLISGITMWVGGQEAEEEGVTRHFAGKNAA